MTFLCVKWWSFISNERIKCSWNELSEQFCRWSSCVHVRHTDIRHWKHHEHRTFQFAIHCKALLLTNSFKICKIMFHSALYSKFHGSIPQFRLLINALLLNKVLKTITYVTWSSGTISDLDHFYISLWISPSKSPFSCLIYSLCTNQAVSISHFAPFFIIPLTAVLMEWNAFSRRPHHDRPFLVPPLFALMFCSLPSFTLERSVRGHANIWSLDKSTFRISQWLQDDRVSTSLSSVAFGQNYDDLCQSSVVVCGCAWRRYMPVVGLCSNPTIRLRYTCENHYKWENQS